MLVICCFAARNWTRRTLPPGTRPRVDAIRRIQLGWQPAWSVGDAAGIAMFPLRPDIGLVDNDESNIGQCQAIECSDWWIKAGCKVLRVIPRSSGDDLNDIVRKWAVA